VVFSFDNSFCKVSCRELTSKNGKKKIKKKTNIIVTIIDCYTSSYLFPHIHNQVTHTTMSTSTRRRNTTVMGLGAIILLIMLNQIISNSKDRYPADSPLIGFHDKFSQGGMTAIEQDLLAKTYGKSSSVFEWGMGSSTLIAEYMGIKRLVGVDSANPWVENVRDIIKHPNYKLIHADIGRIVKFGNPRDQSMKETWPFYSMEVDHETEPFDVYLVDGRFRVACAARALLHGRADSFVFFHDFERDVYQVILEVADKVEEVHSKSTKKNTFVMLQRKTAATDAEIEALWETYKYTKE